MSKYVTSRDILRDVSSTLFAMECRLKCIEALLDELREAFAAVSAPPPALGRETEVIATGSSDDYCDRVGDMAMQDAMRVLARIGELE